MAKQTGFGPKKAYLILYNAASAVAWATILGRVAVVAGWKGAPFVPLVVDNFARITQTFAVMEVLHALTGSWRPYFRYPPSLTTITNTTT
jgi:very-long-chain (3R)-3-hydroxyacyl-CoA dehydratase